MPVERDIQYSTVTFSVTNDELSFFFGLAFALPLYIDVLPEKARMAIHSLLSFHTKDKVVILFLVCCSFASFSALLLEGVLIDQNKPWMIPWDRKTYPPQVINPVATQASLRMNNRIHHPNYFSNQVPFHVLLQRNNILSVFSGCSIAAWTYNGPTFKKWKVPFFDDCKCHHEERNLTSKDITPSTAALLIEPDDTVYVEFTKIPHFVQHTLPTISVDFVLISGQNHLIPQKPKALTYVWDQATFDALVNCPHVTHWFLMNMDIYAHDPDHPKLHPFPYGLGTSSNHTMDTAQIGMNPMQAFRKELSVDAVRKNTTIFVGYFSMRTNKAMRRLVPRGDKLSPALYFHRMHESLYVVSPSGDRPDCYRHYEAIGLGAMPITQMSQKYYRHLEGNVVFDQTTWNLTLLSKTLAPNPKVNRRLVFEEYWMEYVERIAGRPLRWWDPSRNVRCLLAEITDNVKNADFK